MKTDGGAWKYSHSCTIYTISLLQTSHQSVHCLPVAVAKQSLAIFMKVFFKVGSYKMLSLCLFSVCAKSYIMREIYFIFLNDCAEVYTCL